MSKSLIIVHVLLTSLVTTGCVFILGSDAIAGDPLAWVRIILAVSLAGGLLQGSFAARKRGETSTADILLRWATAATAILTVSTIIAEL
jgi:hypothetical protein